MAQRLRSNLVDADPQLTTHAAQHNYANLGLIALGYNVKDYGALGDGTTDDTTAIQDTINAAQAISPLGGVVYVPAGTYKITVKLTISDHVTMLGPGKILQFTLSDHVIEIAPGTDHVTLRGITIGHNAPGARSSHHGIYLRSSTDILIDGITILATRGAGIYAPSNQRCKVINSTVTGCFADGIHFEQDLDDILIANNSVYDLEDDGITVQGINGDVTVSKNCRIIGNYVARTLTRGIAILGVEDSVCEGNTVEDTFSFGIYVFSEDAAYQHRANKGITVRGNTIRDAGTYSGGTGEALRVGNGNAARKTEHVLIDGNIIQTPANHFFNIGQAAFAGTENIVITRNICIGPNTVGNGLNALNVLGLTFDDNKLHGFYGHGAYVETTCGGAISVSRNVFDEGGLGAVANDAAVQARADDMNVYQNIIVDSTSRLQYDVANSGARVNVFGNMRDGGAALRISSDISGTPQLVTFNRHVWIARASVSPASGTWDQGDVADYYDPIPGGFAGARCTTGGTPGTWKTYGAISA